MTDNDVYGFPENMGLREKQSRVIKNTYGEGVYAPKKHDVLRRRYIADVSKGRLFGVFYHLMSQKTEAEA